MFYYIASEGDDTDNYKTSIPFVPAEHTADSTEPTQGESIHKAYIIHNPYMEYLLDIIGCIPHSHLRQSIHCPLAITSAHLSEEATALIHILCCRCCCHLLCADSTVLLSEPESMGSEGSVKEAPPMTSSQRPPEYDMTRLFSEDSLLTSGSVLLSSTLPGSNSGSGGNTLKDTLSGHSDSVGSDSFSKGVSEELLVPLDAAAVPTGGVSEGGTGPGSDNVCVDNSTLYRRMRKMEYIKKLFLRGDGGCDADRENEVEVTLALSERCGGVIDRGHLSFSRIACLSA